MPRSNTSPTERRKNRIAVNLYGEVVGSQVGDGYRCFVTSLSERGLYLDSPVALTALKERKCWVGLELPSVVDPLCIVGEVISTTKGAVFHEAAIRFAWMSPEDWDVLKTWVRRERDVSMTRIKVKVPDPTSDSGVFKLKR